MAGRTPRYMTPTFSVLIGGILPFGAVFIELFFILTSMWQGLTLVHFSAQPEPFLTQNIP
jgi:hypothetical protein